MDAGEGAVGRFGSVHDALEDGGGFGVGGFVGLFFVGAGFVGGKDDGGGEAAVFKGLHEEDVHGGGGGHAEAGEEGVGAALDLGLDAEGNGGGGGHDRAPLVAGCKQHTAKCRCLQAMGR